MKRNFSFVFFAWLGVCLLGAFPFYFSGFFPSFTDAIFESVSGFTTTGATVLRDIEALPNWLLFYRSIIQWIGGMGVLLTFLLLPYSAQGGFLLKKTEVVSLEAQEFLPRFHRSVFVILLFYIALTALQFILLTIFGINRFDALTHSFSTMSTGGFSIRSNGIAFYNSPAAEWICAGFMFLAGINLSLIWLIFRRRAVNVMRNSELKTYITIILIASAIVTAAILRQTPSFGTALRQAFFQTASIISTTGASSVDYAVWPSAAKSVLFFLLFVGGCSFSAAGGIKVVRWVTLSKQMWNEMVRLVYSRGIFNIRLDGKGGNKKAVYGAVGFVFLYFLIVFITAIFVSLSGADVFASFTAALVCLGNIGTPMPFNNFPFFIKWGLSLVMIMGRLELWIVLILFKKDFWRR